MCLAFARFAPVALLGSFAATLLPSSSLAQAAPQVYGVCAYTLDDTEYFSNVFGTATSYEGPANRAFHDYATAQAAGKPLKMASCRFLRTEQAAKDLKETDKRLLGMTGHAQKSTETGWQFTTVAVQTTTTTTTTVQPTVPPASSSASTTSARSGAARQTARATQASAATATANAPAATSAATATNAPAATATNTGVGSIATTTTDTLKNAQTTTTTAVTNSVNGITTTTVNGLTTSATNMVTNLQSRLFNRKKKDPANGTAGAAAPASAPAVTTTVATTATPQPNGSTPVQVVTTTTTGGGMGFYFCHLKADGSDYHSGVFPGTAADQSGATAGFWHQVARQYKLSNIPFSGNVSCTLTPSEAEANTQLKSWVDSAAQRGTAGHVVDTAWTYMGN